MLKLTVQTAWSPDILLFCPWLSFLNSYCLYLRNMNIVTEFRYPQHLQVFIVVDTESRTRDTTESEYMGLSGYETIVLFITRKVTIEVSSLIRFRIEWAFVTRGGKGPKWVVLNCLSTYRSPNVYSVSIKKGISEIVVIAHAWWFRTSNNFICLLTKWICMVFRNHSKLNCETNLDLLG